MSNVLRAAASEESIWFLVDLRDQLDFGRLPALPSRQAQRDWTRRALRAVADRSRRRVQPLLEDLRLRREIQEWVAVSVVNRLLVRGRPAAIRRLARHPEVASLTEEIESEGALDDAGGAGRAGDWPLDAVEVWPAWSAGVDGRGITIGLIDSGASDGHELLRDRFGGGWFDPIQGSKSPSDVQLGHGTAVLSCALSLAPAAKWIAAAGLRDGRYDNVLLTRAADWMLDTGGPDVLIAPWRVPGSRCDGSLRRIADAWRAAGIVVVFAAGNSGPDAGSDVSPANYTGALSVGAVDARRQIYAHSSRGPGGCGEVLFPQLVAPGADVRVALPAGPSLYRTASGTSFAAGFAGGAAALLVQHCPSAPVEEIERALREGATDLGPAGPDPAYGYGLVNVPRSLRWLEERAACR